MTRLGKMLVDPSLELCTAGVAHLDFDLIIPERVAVGILLVPSIRHQNRFIVSGFYKDLLVPCGYGLISGLPVSFLL